MCIEFQLQVPCSYASCANMSWKYVMRILWSLYGWCTLGIYQDVFFLSCQGLVVSQTPYQMVREGTPAPLLGAQSLTPVTQGTGGLQAVLVELVSRVASGQGIIQHVPVSSHFCAYHSV